MPAAPVLSPECFYSRSPALTELLSSHLMLRVSQNFSCHASVTGGVFVSAAKPLTILKEVLVMAILSSCEEPLGSYSMRSV